MQKPERCASGGSLFRPLDAVAAAALDPKEEVAAFKSLKNTVMPARENCNVLQMTARVFFLTAFARRSDSICARCSRAPRVCWIPYEISETQRPPPREGCRVSDWGSQHKTPAPKPWSEGLFLILGFTPGKISGR